jgi:hypothetical protein
VGGNFGAGPSFEAPCIVTVHTVGTHGTLSCGGVAVTYTDCGWCRGSREGRRETTLNKESDG